MAVQRYLGDGLYAQRLHSGNVKLFTAENQEVFLEPAMVIELVKYVFPDKELVDVVGDTDE